MNASGKTESALTIFFSVIRDCAEMLESLDEFLGNPNRNLSPKDEILKENFLSNGLKKLSDE